MRYRNDFRFLAMFVIWIPPEKQGQGLGTAIFERLCGLLDEHGEQFRLGIAPIAEYDIESGEPTLYDDPQVRAEKTAGVERFVKRFGFVKDDYCYDEQYWVRRPIRK